MLTKILLLVLLLIPITTAFAESNKELCKENGGDWEDGSCDFKSDDEDKADDFTEDVDDYRNYLNDKAAVEDDYEDSKRFDATLAFASSNDEKEHCEDNDGYWSKEDKSCNFEHLNERQDYQTEKYKDFGEGQDDDWEYDEEDQ